MQSLKRESARPRHTRDRGAARGAEGHDRPRRHALEDGVGGGGGRRGSGELAPAVARREALLRGSRRLTARAHSPPPSPTAGVWDAQCKLPKNNVTKVMPTVDPEMCGHACAQSSTARTARPARASGCSRRSSARMGQQMAEKDARGRGEGRGPALRRVPRDRAGGARRARGRGRATRARWRRGQMKAQPRARGRGRGEARRDRRGGRAAQREGDRHDEHERDAVRGHVGAGLGARRGAACGRPPQGLLGAADVQPLPREPGRARGEARARRGEAPRRRELRGAGRRPAQARRGGRATRTRRASASSPRSTNRGALMQQRERARGRCARPRRTARARSWRAASSGFGVSWR